eukprot:gene10942-12103_t
MAVQYAPTKLRVPPGFQNLLEGLSREVLREQPSNIIQFAANYFKDQLLIREETSKDDAKKGDEMEKLQSGEEIDIDLNDPSTADAAVKIQAVFRGHKDRREVKQKKEQEDAATKIQAGFRGHQTRKSVKEMRDSSSSVNEEKGNADKSVEVNDDKDENVQSITENKGLEQPEDALDVDLDDPKYEEAATKIQANFRGHKVREEIKSSKSKLSEDIDDKKEDETHELEDEKGEPKQVGGEEQNEEVKGAEKVEETADDQVKEEEAAIKIQASFRGHVARKEVEAIKSSQNVENDDKEAEKVDEDKGTNDEEKAAVKIQAGYRGFVARKEVNAMKSSQSQHKDEGQTGESTDQPAEEDGGEQDKPVEGTSDPQSAEGVDEDESKAKAATKIQASYRGYRIRVNLKSDGDKPLETGDESGEKDAEVAAQEDEVAGEES